MTRARRLCACGVAAVLGALAAPSAGWSAGNGSADRAADSLRAAFPELAEPPRAPRAPDGTVVDEYVGADIARLVDRRGRRSVLLSSLPLRSRVGDGSLQPLSVALRGGAPGEIRPQNPVAHVRIATDPAGGFTIGPDPGHLVTIVPLGLRADASPATAFAGQVLFAGARDATDLLLRPSVAGVQTFEQLHSEAAPESFSYRLELGSGQRAELANGEVTISQAGAVIAQSVPPIALDADRRPVPVSISLVDDVVRLDVPHRQGGFRYPIAVDPDWTSSYDYVGQPGLGLEGWDKTGQVAGGEGPGIYYDAFINTVWDPVNDAAREKLGFFIQPHVTGASRTFPVGVGATLFFNAPGTTHIRSVSYEHVYRFNDRDRQTLRLGLYGPPGGFGEADDVFETDDIDRDDIELPRTPFPEDQDTPATAAVMWMFTSPCNDATDINCPPDVPSGTRTQLHVGSVQLVLTDFDFPTTAADGTLRDLQDRWTNATDARTINPSASDPGSGVRDLSLTVEDANGEHPLRAIQSPCHPDHDLADQDGAICPQDLNLGAPFSLDTGQLLEGRSTFTVDASDLADNTASDGGTATEFSIYLDRNRPSSAASGELRDGADTWTRPRAPSPLTVTGTDTTGGEGRTSGIAHNLLSAVDATGATILDRDADTCTPPGPIATPCDPGKASTFTVDPRTFPEGPVTFSARSLDLASNESEPDTWTVRVDRTPPAARASGDLLGLTSQHTNTTTPRTVTLQGRDAASGVARLQLIASNSDGETVLADRDTCAAGDVDPATRSCPHNAAVEVTVDPGDLPDGPTTFIARAIDNAGIRSVDNQDWDTYVDHTPPDAPDSVTLSQTSNTSVRVSWPEVVDQPLGSGDVSYEVLITAGGQPIGGWRPSSNPGAQVGGLPPGVRITAQVRAVDRAGNVGEPTLARLALRSRALITPERIYDGLGLEDVRHEVEIGGKRAVASATTTGVLRRSLSNLAQFLKKVPKGGIVEVIVEILAGLVSPEPTGCDENRFMANARVVLVDAGRAARAAGAARPGTNQAAATKAITARGRLADLAAEARRRLRPDVNAKDCRGPAEVTLVMIDRLSQALELALVHLGALEAEAIQLSGVVRRTDCKHARDRVDSLGRGPGKRNYVVYWSPPPPDPVTYVGISRALDTRCRAHPNDISDHLETLVLPPLNHAQAHSVEEVLISHFGPNGAISDRSYPDPDAFLRGQLRNIRHSVSPSRPDYCQRLGFGRALLKFWIYGAYTKVIFTSGRRCAGIGP